MQIGRVLNATRVLGKSQGYLGLPVRDEVVSGVPSMLTSWHPTPKELEALNTGAPVHVRILGSSHPPIKVGVGEVPK
jgi:hypothetical protein